MTEPDAANTRRVREHESCATCDRGESHHTPVGGEDDLWCSECVTPWPCAEHLRELGEHDRKVEWLDSGC